MSLLITMYKICDEMYISYCRYWTLCIEESPFLTSLLLLILPLRKGKMGASNVRCVMIPCEASVL